MKRPAHREHGAPYAQASAWADMNQLADKVNAFCYVPLYELAPDIQRSTLEVIREAAIFAASLSGGTGPVDAGTANQHPSRR